MASRTRIIRTDDLDDQEIPEGQGQTVKFSVGSNTYEIDLSDANLGKLYDALQPFTEKARKVGGRGTSVGGKSNGSGAGRTTAQIDRDQLQAMRQWAQENGYKVSSRGRVSKEVQEAYHAAQ